MLAQPLTITSGVRAAAARTPGKIAVTEISGGRRTYAQLLDRIEAIGTCARDVWGLKRGDVAVLLAPNCLEYPEIVGGLSEQGIAVATVNYRLTPNEVSQITADSTAQFVIYHPSCAGLIKDLIGQTCIAIGPELDGALAKARSAHEPIAAEGDTFAIPYTSGTTGLPKGVMVSHRARVMTFYTMAAEYRCYASTSHFLALAPLCHGAGFAFGFAPLFFGGRVDIFPKFDPKHVLEEIAKGEADGIFMVPTHFQALFALDKAVLEACRSKHSLISIISNASALPQPMKHKIVDYFGEGLLHETYGSTEGGIVTNLRPADQLRKEKCVGPAFVDTIIKVLDDDGQEVPPNQPGELFSRGPSMFSGYLNRPDATAETIRDGWISVGDIAVRDDEGYVYIVDRKKDMIISGGINIYPREVETVFIDHPEVADVAIFGVAHEEWGETICAAVVLESGAAADKEALLEWLGDKVARYKLPRVMHFVDDLPRNATGKVLKRVLGERYGR